MLALEKIGVGFEKENYKLADSVRFKELSRVMYLTLTR